ncbi:MAG: hypothetical protein K1X79_09245 [Oligoflexia bacterium]|nr:hypothetical protein [Oligoflexia bacterium]
MYRPADPSGDPERKQADLTDGHPHALDGIEAQRFELLASTLGRRQLEAEFLHQVGAETHKLMELLRAGRMERFDGHQARLGLEMEMHLADAQTGRPAGKNKAVLAELCQLSGSQDHPFPDPKAWTCELAKWQMECRTGVANCAG